MKKIHIVLLAAGIVFIFRFIWLRCCPYALLDLDTGTIGLMARHILAGHFPMFFYGQDYLAPVESYIIAPFFFVFGDNHIVLQLVPVGLTLVCGVVVFFLGKAIKDEAMGLWSALLFLFPPVVFFLKGFKSQGYMPEYLLCGTLIFLLSFKIVERAADKSARKMIMIYYLLLGVVSGIGFWIVYSTVQFIVIAGLFLVFHFRRSKIFTWGLIWPVTFVLAGLPYWIFSYQNNWDTFYFGKVTRYSLRAITNKLFTVDLRNLLTAGLSEPLRVLLVAAYAVIFIFYLVYGIKTRRSKMLPVWLLAVLIFLFYINPSLYRFAIRADTRYVIGIYLALALMAGFTLSRLNEKKRGLGTICGLLLIGINSYTCIEAVPRYRQQSLENKQRFDRLTGLLKENSIDKVLVRGREFRDLAFVSDEKIICAKYDGDDYPKHQEAFEQALAMAYYMPKRDSSLAGVCAGFNKVEDFYFDFKRYPYRYREIPPDNWLVISNYQGDKCWQAVDRDLSTMWSSAEAQKPGMFFCLDLGKSYLISKIQLFYADRYYSLPEQTMIQVSADGVSWQEVLTVEGTENFFWSGPRLCYLIVNGRYEFNFEPVEARFVKISQLGKNSPYSWDIAELFIYEYAGEDPSGWDEEKLRQAYEYLKGKGIDRVYADFWESAMLKKWGGVWTVNIFDNITESSKKRYIKLSADTGFIVPAANKDGWESLLAELGVELASKRFGPYWCYFFGGLSEEEKRFYDKLRSVYWLGTTGVKIDLYRYSDLLYERGLAAEAKGEKMAAESFYRRALERCPRYMPYKRLKTMGADVTPWRQYFEPEKAKHISFANGLVFLGITSEKQTVRPGEEINLDYFWGVSARADKDAAVFVHFKKDGRVAFQGDYFLRTQHLYLQAEPYDVVRFRYRLTVPPDVPPGDYSIVLGLWLPEKEKRVRERGSNRTKFDVGSIVIE